MSGSRFRDDRAARHAAAGDLLAARRQRGLRGHRLPEHRHARTHRQSWYRLEALNTLRLVNPKYDLQGARGGHNSDEQPQKVVISSIYNRSSW